ncbi:dipeptidase PepV [Acholeplasma hippikon]|uniref:Dipeptidase SA1572 n=1 Tax=Acholeplasma hippikon TaxID=264636 RepID=A0A449BIU0_9MOLU|nr:dipeptidase PepV [Acholeplasma hippikon]VEU82375.1 Putative dipeptidase SA1572 [Acholeplasma hippikon]
MNIDFKALVLKYKDQMIKDTQDLLRIDSELTTFDPERIGAPFGEGNKQALDFMLNMANKDGFRTENVDGYAGHIEFGDSEDYIGSIGHLDVVPAGTGWTYPPYGAEIHDNKIYARGAEDDKGPTMAVYYAMKILKEEGIKLSKRIKLILGIDEESGWRCVNYYFKKYPQAPVAGFISDADFPLIYAEKGITSTIIRGSFDNSVVRKIEGGLRSNMVPESARAYIVKDLAYKEKFENYLKEHNLVGKVSVDDEELILEVEGKSAHGSLPQDGVNAIHLMFNALNYMGISNEFIEFVNKYLNNDYLGVKLGIAYTDKEMGELTVNWGTLKTEGNRFEIVLNLRYPNGVNYQKDVFEHIETLLIEDYKVTVEHHQKLLYKDPNSHLIKTLMGIYKKHTGDESPAISIGGGTFARATDNVVAFGPHFPGKPTYIHQKDEFIDIDDLITATIIYTESFYELAK